MLDVAAIRPDRPNPITSAPTLDDRSDCHQSEDFFNRSQHIFSPISTQSRSADQPVELGGGQLSTAGVDAKRYGVESSTMAAMRFDRDQSRRAMPCKQKGGTLAVDPARAVF
ncbi:MAG: hypothetical protein NT113_00070 [Hyphomicrobiales bacterium]|nr:hypothetical protein [Hyphomicrobiales bacterium]